MESLAVSSALAQAEEHPIELLIADDDAGLRSLVSARAHAAVATLVVHEAADGMEAVQIGLQRRPQIALLDVNMPRLDGIEVALVLRGLLPELQLALHTADPARHCDTARELCLPLFDKSQPERALRWLENRARSYARRPTRVTASPKFTLECSACGYAIARSAPPKRCPMCQREGSWMRGPRRAPL